MIVALTTVVLADSFTFGGGRGYEYVDSLYFFSPSGNPATAHSSLECALMTSCVQRPLILALRAPLFLCLTGPHCWLDRDHAVVDEPKHLAHHLRGPRHQERRRRRHVVRLVLARHRPQSRHQLDRRRLLDAGAEMEGQEGVHALWQRSRVSRFRESPHSCSCVSLPGLC